jgi:hypothetical protein
MRSQSLETDPLRDRIEATDAKGAAQIVYFFPHTHFDRLNKKQGIPPMPATSSQ